MEDVYIARAGAQSKSRNTGNKIKALCTAAGLANMVNPGDLTAVKVHFGEEGKKIWRETNMPYVVDRTRKVTFRDGKLMLFIDSAPLKQELFNSRDQIRDKVNKALDSDIVQEIVIR